METYQVSINIAITPCTQGTTSTPQMQEDGSFQITISERDAMSIDHSEQALLRTAYPALRAALSTHLSVMSKKKPLNR